MSGTPPATSLQHRHIFGINSDVAGNISFTTDDLVVYVAGHTIVLFSLSDRRQRFLNAAEITEKMTAYASGPGRRLCAVAERGERPQVHVFDLRTFRRKKTITVNETQAREFVALNFSEDDQSLVTLSGAPDWILTSWNWAKAKVIASVKASFDLPMCQCMYSPIDTTIAVCCGQQYVKFFRIVDKEARVLHETHMPEQNFTCMTWMRHPDDHLLAGTESGEVFMFRAGQLVMSLPCAPGPAMSMAVTSMASCRGGFIAGSTQGTLFFYGYDETRDQALFDDQFRLLRQQTTEHSSGAVLHIALCPADEKVCVLTSDAQLLSVPLYSSSSGTPQEITPTVTSFHGPSPIVGMDICLRKPLLLTCSADKSLRVWNFEKHCLEFSRTYGEEMYAVAIHPTGMPLSPPFRYLFLPFSVFLSFFSRLCHIYTRRGDED